MRDLFRTGKLFDAVIEIDESFIAFGRELQIASHHVNVRTANQFHF